MSTAKKKTGWHDGTLTLPVHGAATKPVKVPNSLGAAIDLLYELRAQRLELERSAEKWQAAETRLKEYLLEHVAKTDLEGARGEVGQIGINRKLVARVVDWDKARAYIFKKKAWDLLRRQLNDAACVERWEDKQTIDGVEPFPVMSLSVTKRVAKKARGAKK